MRRKALSRSHSKGMFTRHALRVHPKNMMNFAGPMRGGIRL